MTEPGTPRIRILDPATVNQIAAGEVVERPASVVKELIENAIDAGAGTIRIDLLTTKDAIASIRVTDDGCGMSPADAELAFVPHATSKIVTIDDLHATRTLGFRGEALASIAAVARVTLVTKERGAVAATRIVIAGGEITASGPAGAPDGTSILVEDLFFNTPARRKFQKSKNTELAHIHEVLEGICIAHPGIAFRLTGNGSDLLVTDRSSRRLDTIARLYGPDVSKDLMPLEETAPLVTISGSISRPSLTRRDRARMFIAINGRHIVSNVLNDAIRSGYGTLLPKDRFPVAFLDLAIDTALVDVNVHPAKKHIRLSQEREIANAVRGAVSAAVLRHDLIPAASPPPSMERAPTRPASPGTSYPHPEPGPVPSGVFECTHAGTVATDQRLRQTELVFDAAMPAEDSGLLPDLEVIGTFGGIYILAGTKEGDLMVIDQHAAHERILYEQVAARAGEAPKMQELISPVVLNRSNREMALIHDLLPDLAAEGFVLENFGGGSFLVRSVPVVLGRIEDASIIDDIISDLISDEASVRVSARERIIRIVACRGAVKAGTACTPEQCRRIIGQLRRTKSPFTCPHGRPTIIRFTRRDLDGMFQRV